MKSQLLSLPNPARTYEQAVAKYEQLSQRSTATALNPLSEDILLTYNRKTERSIVLLHGYTNSPHQFRQLGGLFFAAGYNVLIPRMPHHGLRDRYTTEQAKLTAQELTRHADSAVDIATGLGEHVTVMGISAGGNLTGWLLHQRPEVNCAVLIAPAFGVKVVRPGLTKSAIQAALTLPNRFISWKGPEFDNVGPQHAYPQFSTHALGNILMVGQDVVRYSSLRQPFADDIVVITNENDMGVNNELTNRLVTNWRNLGALVRTHHFDKQLQLDHDSIDPDNPSQSISLVYPLLMDFVRNSPSHTPVYA